MSRHFPNTQILRAVFTDSIVEELTAGTPHDLSETSFARLLLSVVQDHTAFALISTRPTSVDKMLEALVFVLTDETRLIIRQNGAEFNEICGMNESDQMVHNLTLRSWVIKLADVVQHTSQRSLSSTKSGSSTSSYPPTIFSIPSRTTPSSSLSGDKSPKIFRSLDKSFDGTSESEPAQNPRIIQVNLEGPNIKSAWSKNRTIVDRRYKWTIRQLEEFGPDYAYTADKAGSFSVFHGTIAHHKFPDWISDWNDEKMSLSSGDEGGQMAPFGLGVVYTSFSALRSFLWAAFQEHLYRNLPGAKDEAVLRKSWTSNGQTFTGVAVFAFEIVQPRPNARMHAYTIPRGTEQQWANKMGEMSGRIWKNKGKEAWEHIMANSRPKDIKQWPEILSASEYGQQESSLSPFKVNLQRTCWSGSGIEYLNSQYRYTMAISFRKVLPPTSTIPRLPAAPLQRDDEGDRDKDSGTGKGKGRLQEVRKKVSGLFSKKKH